MERIHANDFVEALDPKVVISIMWLVKLLRCFKWSWVKILWLEMIQILPKTDGPGALRLKSRQHEEVLRVRLGLGGAQNVCLYLFAYWDHGNIHKPLKKENVHVYVLTQYLNFPYRKRNIPLNQRFQINTSWGMWQRDLRVYTWFARGSK